MAPDDRSALDVRLSDPAPSAPPPGGSSLPPRPPNISPSKNSDAWRRPRLLLTFILLFPLALFVMAGVRAFQLAREGEVPEALRDLNCDGKVSMAEWLRGGIDFRLRPSQLVPGCQDVYAVKSGQVLVVRCPEEPRCRRAADLRPSR